MSKKVCVIPPYYGADSLFGYYGWELVSVSDVFFHGKEVPDVVVFTGGEDIDASYYGERTVDPFWTDSTRDKREWGLIEMAIAAEFPLAGICRGGQLLNIYGGGSMYQHVTEHFRNHPVVDKDGFIYNATSVHHQMMIPGTDCEYVAWAVNMGTRKYKGSTNKGTPSLVFDEEAETRDCEGLFYPDIKAFCYQPHPEYAIGAPLADLWWDYLRFYLGVG